jgi:predicted nucleotidyltransferase
MKMRAELAPVLTLLENRIPNLAAIYVFGSEASGMARPDSDVDIAVFAGRPIALELIATLREAAAKLLLRDVDLVDLAAADTILQMQVLSEGKAIASFDSSALGFFELRVLRDYRDLKRRRAGIEADIVKRGRVYAR